MKRNQQQGFTLIELVVVLVILSILGAIAAPKYTSMLADARLAKMNAAVGAMKSAAAMAHAQLIARGFNNAETISQASMQGLPLAQQVIMEGVTVGFVNGYPDASQIAEISGISPPDYVVLAAGGSEQVVAPDNEHDGTGGNPACTITYNNAAFGFPPTYDINATLATCL